MTLLVLSLGSNVEPKVNIKLAVESLRKKFGELLLSSVYESEAVGFEGNNFLNLVTSGESDDSLEEVQNYLKMLEDDMGRERDKPKFSDRPIDIDILLLEILREKNVVCLYLGQRYYRPHSFCGHLLNFIQSLNTPH